MLVNVKVTGGLNRFKNEIFFFFFPPLVLFIKKYKSNPSQTPTAYHLRKS